MNSFLKDLFAVMKSRGIIISCGLLTSIITARYLGPAGTGLLATLVVYPDLFLTIGARGMSQSITFLIGQKKYSDDEVFNSGLYVWLINTVVCMIICFILLNYFAKTDFPTMMIALAIIPLPFSLFNTMSTGLFLGKNNIKEFNKVNWIPTVLQLVGTLIFVILIPMNVTGAMIGIVCGYSLLAFMVYPKVRLLVKINWNLNFIVIRQLLKLGAIYTVTLLVISLNYKIDVVLLERLSTPYEVGIYTKGVSVVQYLWEIPTLLSTIIFARSASSFDPKGFSHKVCLLLRVCSVIIFMLGIFFFFASSIIMVTIYGERYLPSSVVQKIMIPGIWLLTIFKVLNMDLAGKGKPWITIFALLPALIINVGLNIVLDTKYGANGAAVASTISYAISAILFLVLYSREVKIPILDIIRFNKNDIVSIQLLFGTLKNKLKLSKS